MAFIQLKETMLTLMAHWHLLFKAVREDAAYTSVSLMMKFWKMTSLFSLFCLDGLDSDIHLGNVSSTNVIMDNDGEFEHPSVVDLELVKGGSK